jgi:hypothetical protein
VQGFRIVVYKVTFKPNQPAVVQIQGDGDTLLSVVVLDHQGKKVTSSPNASETATVKWKPTSEEPYQIKIYNRGGVPNRFMLKTN